MCVGAFIGTSAAQFVLEERGSGLLSGFVAECTKGRAHIRSYDWGRMEEVGKGRAGGKTCAGVAEGADVVVIVVLQPAVSVWCYGAAYFAGFGALGAGCMRSLGCRATRFAEVG